jgi:pimeloyl-ACP methyl ester carboxylesterase
MPDTAVPTSHHFTSQGLRLHYVDWGNPTAPLLILQHGGRDHARSWDWVAQSLRHNWHVIAPDLRGHGDSAWSPDAAYLMPPLTYDLAELIRHLGAGQVTLVAHSLGGAVATRYASLYPHMVRRLVAIEGIGPSAKSMEQSAEIPADQRWLNWMQATRTAATRTSRRYDSFADAQAQLQAKNRRLTDAQARHLTQHGTRRQDDGTYIWKFDPGLQFEEAVELSPQDRIQLWRRITCPTLICWGRDSWASDPQADGRAAHFPNAEVLAFSSAGHWLHHDQFNTFMQALRQFL